MLADLLPKLDRGLRAALPSACLLLAALFTVAPLGIPGFGAVAPDLLLAVTVYWAVQRPDLLPNTPVFLIGLLGDVLTGGIFGLTPAVLLVARFAAVSQRRYLGRTFMMFWAGFALIALGAVLLEGIVSSLARASLLPLTPALVSAALTAALFPPIAWVLAAVQKAVPDPADVLLRR